MGLRKHFLVGRKFGRLTVIKEASIVSNYRRRWLCQCECGGTKTTIGKSLLNGDTKSCGCLQKEVTAKTRTVHGLRYTPEFYVWSSMKDRCRNPNCRKFKFYGARGVCVTPEWEKFENFYRDMGPRPSSAHSIERMDSNGNYEPSNVYWATKDQQNRTQRSTLLVSIDEMSEPMGEWGRLLGIDRSSAWTRSKKNRSDSGEEMLRMITERIEYAYRNPQNLPRRSRYRGWLL